METQRMMKLTKVNKKSHSLPLDLMMEILKLVPVKTLIRFMSVSKLWASTIRSRDFTKLFMNVSLTKPKGLLFFLRHRFSRLDNSSVLSQNTHDESYSFTNLHVTCHSPQWTTVSPSVHGLICYEQSTTRLVIYNPCTRRSITLPEIDTWRRHIYYFLGYDPIDNDYKVLCTMSGKTNLVKEFRVLTVGQDDSWRMIENNIVPHAHIGQELCISGVLYYQALYGTKMGIMSFDVRSEKLHPIKVPSTFLRRNKSSKLISYEGMLAIIFFEKKVVKLCVLGDAATEEWFKTTFVLPTTFLPVHWHGKFSITETDTGEIIFAPECLDASVSSLPCYDMKTDSAKIINIQGIPESKGEYYVKSVSSSMVENLMFL